MLENEQVLVIETAYPVGGAVPTHRHAYPHVIYVIEGGTVQTTAPDGAMETLELRPRETLWAKAQSHSTRNIGSTPVRILEVEVKSAATVGGERTPRVATPSDLDWRPDPLDPSRLTALLVGDPTGPGPYAVRIRVGGGYRIGLHEHPTEDESLTVLSGAVHWSTGAAGSAPEHVAPAGTFLLFPAGTPHRLWTAEATVLQMTGVGPRTYRYADPAHDPRVLPMNS